MDFIIRPVAVSDARELIRFVQELAEETDIFIVTEPGEFQMTVGEEEKFIAEISGQDNAIFLLALSNGRIIGSLDCRGGKRKGIRHAATLGISIHKAWRNRGVGTAMMAHVMEWAKGSPVITRIELAVFAQNTPAIHLYEKFGFSVEGRRKNAIFRNRRYHDDLIMGWVKASRVES